MSSTTSEPQAHNQPAPKALPALFGRPLISRNNTVAATWALFLGLGLVMTGNGLQGSLLGIRVDTEGFGATVSGIVMACYFAGFFAGSVFALHVLKSVGHIRVFAALASTASSAALLHALFVNPISWGLMRFVTGLCFAGLYVVVESWLNELADNETRGRLLSTYMLVTMVGLSAGQLLLNIADPAGFTLFIVASILVSMALVPVALSESSAPTIIEPQKVSVKAIWDVVPTGVVGALTVGAASGALMGLGAVYASSVGMSQGRITIFVTAPMLGALVAQMPIGTLSDKFSRRGVMLAVAALAVFSTLVGIVADPVSNLGLLAMFGLGATLFPLYTLSIAYTNDWLAPEQRMGAAGTLVRINGTGAVAGPVIGAFMKGIWGPNAFFGTMSVFVALLCIYIGYRILVADKPPEERKVRFVSFPARGGTLATQLLPRPIRKLKRPKNNS